MRDFIQDNVEARKDLTPAMLDVEFENRFAKFHKFWHKLATNRAEYLFKWVEKDGKKQKVWNKHIVASEIFYGEAVEKFEGLDVKAKRACLESETPLAFLFKETNLTMPKVFADNASNYQFKEVLTTENLK